MLSHNKDMQSYLKRHGIECVPKRLDEGSMKGTWRLYQKWAELRAQDIEKLTELGFLDYDGKPLSWLSGHGGGWQLFVQAPTVSTCKPGSLPPMPIRIY